MRRPRSGGSRRRPHRAFGFLGRRGESGFRGEVEPIAGPDADLALEVERTDAAAALDLVQAAPAAFAAEHGVAAREIGGATVVRAAGFDILAFNRAVGLGVESQAEEAALDRIVEEYRRADVARFFVQVSPHALPRALPGWLRARGLEPYNRWMKLSRPADPLPDPGSGLHVRLARSEEAPVWAGLVLGAFGMSDGLRPWLQAFVGRESWSHLLAFDGEVPIAAAALYVIGRVGYLTWAGTDPSHRGRGAQSTLIAARVALARERGCRRIVVETAEDRPEKPAPSFRNLTRLGFRLLYPRENWIGRRP